MRVSIYYKKIIKYGYNMVVDTLFVKIFSLLKKRNVIFFESVPSFSDSPKAIFDEFIKRGVNKKYRIIWWLYDDIEELPKINNVRYIKKNYSRIMFRFYECTSICLISCNRPLEAHSKHQKSYYIMHGSPLKKVQGYYNLPKGINFYFCASDYFIEESAKQLNIDSRKGIGLGLPRNDVLGGESTPIKNLFKCNYSKIIVWYPTFRQHKTGVNTDSTYALPIIYDDNSALELNEYAMKKDVLIVIKPHFAQNLDYLRNVSLSNIYFISDSFFYENNLSSYQFINSCDALITDYSSVYYDYLLCNKPVALVWEDINEYKSNPGFSVDIDYLCKGGEKIYDLNDFKMFICRVATNEDIKKKERNDINRLVNFSNDRGNTIRVTDFIIKHTPIMFK